MASRSPARSSTNGTCLRLAGFAVLLYGAAAQAQIEVPASLNRLEPGVLPALGGDSDVGFKFGAFGQLVRFRDGISPYAWRAQAYGIMSVHDGATGTEFPYREASVTMDVPAIWGSHLRIFAELSFLRTTNYGYFGLGNASHAERLWINTVPGSDAYRDARHFNQYDGSQPRLRVVALEQLTQRVRRFMSLTLSETQVRPYSGSLLAHHIYEGAGGGQTLFGVGTTQYLTLGLGVAYDTRNHETVTSSGQFHEFSLRIDPGAFGADPYLGANVTLRSYAPIAGEYLFVAGRVVGDVLSRRAPLFEMSNYGGQFGGQGPGGYRGIRGVPQGRLMGRTKCIANSELRSQFLPFSWLGQAFNLGAAAFFDFGRVWTGTLQSVQALDGHGLGLHWGAGAGPRLRWGDSLWIRADIAYAPLGRALGTVPAYYVDVEQVL